MRCAPLFVCLAGLLFVNVGRAADAHALVEAGLPALSREWTGADYVKTVELLEAGAFKLPTLADAAGPEFLDRITSRSNLGLVRNQTLSSAVRLEEIQSLLRGCSQLLSRYAEAMGRGKPTHTEVARMLAFCLYIAEAGVNVMVDFVHGLPPEAMNEARKEGYRKFKSGLTTMFTGAEATLSEERYTDEDRARIITAMADTIAVLQTIFDGDYKLELRHKIKLRQQTFTDPVDAKHLANILEALN